MKFLIYRPLAVLRYLHHLETKLLRNKIKKAPLKGLFLLVQITGTIRLQTFLHVNLLSHELTYGMQYYLKCL